MPGLVNTGVEVALHEATNFHIFIHYPGRTGNHVFGIYVEIVCLLRVDPEPAGNFNLIWCCRDYTFGVTGILGEMQ